MIEVKLRKSGEVKILATDTAVDFILSYVSEGI